MWSAEYSCKLFKPIFCIPTNSVDPEQSDLGPHCLQKWLIKSQADDKVDDNIAVIGSLRVKLSTEFHFSDYFISMS